ncbi:hypothetical protein HMPREF1992_00096 [Selenomonas sp. oral taxon 892 str. F0426]|nr:hypothetical protein HMPREF1992_00096 [Selenomonas sp. oral taxon 892 str. F0426]
MRCIDKGTNLMFTEKTTQTIFIKWCIIDNETPTAPFLLFCEELLPIGTDNRGNNIIS